MAVFLIAFCAVSGGAVMAIAVVRWWRNPEHLRWLRIEKRARTRAAAQRAAAKYADLPAMTVMPPLMPSDPSDDRVA